MDKSDMKELLKDLLRENLTIRLSDASDMCLGDDMAIRVMIEFDGERMDSDYIIV